MIFYVESIKKFFCYSIVYSLELDDFMNKLEECYSFSVENIFFLNVGFVCVVWYDGWYRVKVK